MSETKPKPRFNVIDAIILIAITALVAVIGYKAMTGLNNAVVSAKTVDVAITVRIRGIMPDLAQAIVKELPGDCVSGKDVVSGSVVKSATIEPATSIVSTDDGLLVDSVDPTRVDLVVIVEGKTPESNAVYSIGNQEVRIGRSFIVKTALIEQVGTITDMTVSGGKG